MYLSAPHGRHLKAFFSHSVFSIYLACKRASVVIITAIITIKHDLLMKL